MANRGRDFIQWVRGLFKTLSVGVVAAVGVFLLVFLIFLVRIFKDLPDVQQLKSFTHSHATEVFSDDGRKIGEFTVERRYPVAFEKIPKHVVQAFLAAEDAKFYEHKGVDLNGILRAVGSNLLKGRYAQGGSTITQQVARVLLLNRKKEITRKVREMILAWRMEKSLTKDEILSLYMSEIYLGHGAYGIGAAARNYFNKRVEELTLAEGALLAGLPQRPHDWDPFRRPSAAKQRQGYVLRRMVDEGFLNEEAKQQAAFQPLRLYRLEELNNKAAPYFNEYVRAYLMKKYGAESILTGGYKVYTTVRYDFQKAAEEALQKGLRTVDKRLGWRGPRARLASAEAQAAFIKESHEKLLSEAVSSHILPAEVSQELKQLPVDLSVIESATSPYIGNTPVRVGEYYDAVVVSVDDKSAQAKIQIGQTIGSLPFSSAGWVREADQPLRSLSQILKAGDVIQVRVERGDKKKREVVASIDQQAEVQGALLSYDHATGAVLAMVGGTDFAKSPFNRALQAKRQVGSTFKPLIYAAAIDKGLSPSSIVTDSPIVFKFDDNDADSEGEDWRPQNFGEKFQGDIPLRLALVRSMNIPTIKIFNEIGIDYGIDYVRRLGITAPLPRDLTIALGSWSSSLEEVMRAYAIFPRQGRPVELNYIKKIVDSTGQIIEEPAKQSPPLTAPPDSPQPLPSDLVVSSQTAYVITDMLKGVVREGTGTGASAVPGPVAGKTGTSNDHRDAWFIGYNASVMAGVWIGFDKDSPLDRGETGGRAAAPIWADYMQTVVKTFPSREFPIPEDIVFAYVDRDTGRLASPASPRRVRVAFKIGTVPDASGANIHYIGEPGARAMTAETPETDGAPEPDRLEPDSNPASSDLLREGYD